MSDPKVEEIRKQVEATHDGGIIGCNHIGGHCGVWVKVQPVILSLLTKLDEAEASIREIAERLRAPGYADGDRVRIALLHIEAIESGTATPLAAAEERERALIAGVREANARYERSAYEEPSFSVATDMFIALAPLSRLLPSTPTEEGNSDE